MVTFKCNVRSLTFEVKIKNGSQTIKWLCDLAVRKWTSEMHGFAKHFAAVNCVDKISGMILMPGSSLKTLVRWYPHLHPVVSVIRFEELPCSTPIYRNRSRVATSWECFRVVEKALNIQYSSLAEVHLSHSDEELKSISINYAQAHPDVTILRAFVIPQCSIATDGSLEMKRDGSRWRLTLQVPTTEKFQYAVALELSKESELDSAADAAVYAHHHEDESSEDSEDENRVSFANYKEKQWCATQKHFEALWKESGIQSFLNDKRLALSEETKQQLHALSMDNWKHITVAFRALCASGGDPKWLSASTFRNFLEKAKLLARVRQTNRRKSISHEVWQVINGADKGVTKLQVEGDLIIKADANNMDISEFLEALLRLSAQQIPKKSMTEEKIIETYCDMTSSICQHLFSTGLFDVERFIDSPRVLHIFKTKFKAIEETFRKFAGTQGTATMDVGEFKDVVHAMVAERVDKNLQRSFITNREIEGIFWSSQELISKKSGLKVCEDDYRLCFEEFYESIVRLSLIFFKAVARLPKEKQHSLPDAVTEALTMSDFEKFNTVLDWILI